jgi:2-polyprenyl-6-methoxyphenol hydroxylase-like FAD-dependent oxidoreductase
MMHVIIVGAGPSGLAAALALSNLGWTVDLLEKHSSFDMRGSTLGLAPNGSKALVEILPNEDISTLTDMGLCVPGFGGVSGVSFVK